MVEQNALAKASEQTTTRQILAELQPLYQEAYGHSFTESLVKCTGTGIQRKKTDVETKRMKRRLQQECKHHIEQHLQSTDAINVLAEGQSLASYKRLRLSQSFESPQSCERAASKKKHSPKFDAVEWDKEGLLNRLRNWPLEHKINWTEIGREFGVPGRNKGQVVKEFAMENDVNVFDLDKRPPNTRVRARKLRMPGGAVSVPTHRSVGGIKEDWAALIASGELTLGEPCHPHTLKKYIIKNGEIQETTTVVYGRKIPILELRQKLLDKHQNIMQLHTDDEIASLDKQALLQILKTRYISLPNDLSTETLQTKLKQAERTRTLGIWHDHSSILGRGYILITVKVFFDSAIFCANLEHMQAKDIQAYIEEPEVSIIAMSSSSIQDQAALIADRMECIQDMSTSLCTTSGVPITDKLKFFYGDKPAAQFERGTQIGGHYPCGSCGTHVSRFDDFAYRPTANGEAHVTYNVLL